MQSKFITKKLCESRDSRKRLLDEGISQLLRDK